MSETIAITSLRKTGTQIAKQADAARAKAASLQAQADAALIEAAAYDEQIASLTTAMQTLDPTIPDDEIQVRRAIR